MRNQMLLKISVMTLVLIILLLSPVFAAWVYHNYDFIPSESVAQNPHLFLHQFTYDDPGSVLPGGPGSAVVTTPSQTTPETPPEESTPEQTQPGGAEDTTPEQTTPETPQPPAVEDGENHYNLLEFIVGNIGQEGLNIQGGIINRFVNRTAGPEYSQDNTSAGGNLPKEFEFFNAENLQFILTFDKRNNPTVCYAYTYETIEQYDNDAVEGTYVVVYKTLIEPIGTNGEWVATRAYKGYAIVGDPPNKKVNWAPLIEQWVQGEYYG